MPLVSAQGAVREGAQAIDNLLHLLGSRRVGPKAIGQALVDVRDGCAGFVAALGTLSRELTDLFAGDEEAIAIARSLLEQATACVERLGAELAAVKKVDLDARARLAVEAAARKASGELEAALFLVDLLACAAAPRVTQLDAGDVLHGQPITPSKAGRTRLTFLGDARIVGGLMLLGTSIVAHATGQPPAAFASPLSDERLEVRIALAPPAPPAPPPRRTGPGRFTVSDRPAAPAAPAAPIPAYGASPQGQAVARVVARLADIELAIGASGREVTLVLGRAQKDADR